MEQVRLNKFLAQSGVCSRRDADKLIAQGVVRLNDRMATLGDQVTEDDVVSVNGKQIKVKYLSGPQRQLVLAYYKPVGVICTEKDKHAEKKVTDFVKTPVRVTYAGRLDKDSEGLLLMTNDGNLIDAMMRSSNQHEKEYIVKVNKEITEEFVEKMVQGVYLKELQVKTRPCQIFVEGPYTFRIILTQGLNRQIRRMCQTCGYQVKTLKRIRVMNIVLGKMKPGEYRELLPEELFELRQCLQKSSK